MNVGSWDSDSIKTLFSSVSNSGSNSSLSPIYNNLSELNSIKSGAYGKLAKQYYAKDTKSDSKDTTVNKKDSEKYYSQMETRADQMVEASKDLYSNRSLWTKENGEYKTDKIYDAVSNFVEKYNSLISTSSSSEVSQVASASSSMVNLNNSNKSILEKLGIKMDSTSYKLSIDKETFEKADMSAIKTLFSGTGSYAYQMGTQASMIRYAAGQETSSGKTYTQTGAKSSKEISGTLYDENA